jgi:hypothetical protein
MNDPNAAQPIGPPAAPAVAANNQAILTVVVPQGGQVWFDNVLTPQDGTKWIYKSPAVETGKTQVVSVKARWEGGSFDLPLRLQGGDNMTIDLTKTR